MRLVVPFGQYSAGNTGDEATLNGLAALLGHHGLDPSGVWTGARHPGLMPRAEPAFSYFGTAPREFRRWFAKRRSTAYAIVGATPIQEGFGEWPFNELTPIVRQAIRRRTPLAFIGVGIEPLRDEARRRVFSAEYAPNVLHWSPRTIRGRDRLIEYGVLPERITLAADLAWLIEPVGLDFGLQRLRAWGVDPKQPIIGVDVGCEVFDTSPTLAVAMAHALDALIAERDARVIFFAHDVTEQADRDLAAARSVISAMRRADRTFVLPNEYLTPRQFMSVVGCCAVTVSMHYHFCVYSALQRVPFVTIQHTDKVNDLCADIELSASTVTPDADATELAELARKLLAGGESLRKLLTHSVARMRERALQNGDSLRVLEGL